jgi:ABC-type transport system involved in multi-copper enzyme maturation permease subunit
MIGSLRAEFMKLGRRPALWVLTGLAVAAIVLLVYGLLYLGTHNPTPGDQPARVADAKLRLYPADFLWEVLGNLSSFHNALALILGALAFGSEYGWGTWKTVFTQAPSRLEAVTAKFVVVAPTIAVWTIATLVAAALCSYVAATPDGSTLHWPGWTEIARAAGSVFLVLLMWATMGAMLAIALRQAAVALGLGIVYAAIELLLAGAIRQRGGVLRALPGFNATALADSFAPSHLLSPPTVTVSPGQATLVLALYICAFVLAAAFLIGHRDVT